MSYNRRSGGTNPEINALLFGITMMILPIIIVLIIFALIFKEFEGKQEKDDEHQKKK